MPYWKKDGKDLVIVGVYVDDLLVTGTDTADVDRFFAGLGSLAINDLGAVHKFLGMQVIMEDDGSYLIDQETAIRDILREHVWKMQTGCVLLLVRIATRSQQQTARC